MFSEFFISIYLFYFIGLQLKWLKGVLVLWRIRSGSSRNTRSQNQNSIKCKKNIWVFPIFAIRLSMRNEREWKKKNVISSCRIQFFGFVGFDPDPVNHKCGSTTQTTMCENNLIYQKKTLDRLKIIMKKRIDTSINQINHKSSINIQYICTAWKPTFGYGLILYVQEVVTHFI